MWKLWLRKYQKGTEKKDLENTAKVLDVLYESNTEVVSTTEALEVPETLVHKIHKKLPNSAEKSTATLTYLPETDLFEGLISNTFQKLVIKLWMKMIS